MPMLNGLDLKRRTDQARDAEDKVGFSINEYELRCCCRCVSQGGFSLRNETISRNGIGACRNPRKVIRGEWYLSPLIARETLIPLLNNTGVPLPQITQRQIDILQLLAEGMSMKQIANVLKIRPGTVAFHKYRMMERLKVKTNVELARLMR